MSRDPKIRARRHKTIQEIFREGFEIEEQKDLVNLLYQRGFDVTQSSVSRDLRDLGAIRRNGVYELPEENLGWESFARIVDYLKRGLTIGDHMILLEVKRGSAGLVANIIDESGWADVAGTMASTDDKVLILTENAERQANVLKRIPYGGAEDD